MSLSSLRSNDDHVLPFKSVMVKDYERGKIDRYFVHQLLIFFKTLCVITSHKRGKSIRNPLSSVAVCSLDEQ